MTQALAPYRRPDPRQRPRPAPARAGFPAVEYVVHGDRPAPDRLSRTLYGTAALGALLAAAAAAGYAWTALPPTNLYFLAALAAPMMVGGAVAGASRPKAALEEGSRP